MPPLFRMLHQLDPSDVNQAVKLRLIRCYSLRAVDDTNNIYSLECVFLDAEGARIHASIKKVFISRFQNILREGNIYAIKNFVMANNTMKIRTSTFAFKMVFIPKTNVVEVFEANFPHNVYDFKVYDDLSLWENWNEEILIDVIGRISSRSALQTREVQGRETRMLDITLKNLQGNVIPCTLWGDYAEELMNHIVGEEGAVVVIMQMCKVKKFRGEVRLSNTFNVSKVIFDGNVAEIADFQRGLVLEGPVDIAMTNLTTPTSMTIREELQQSRDKILSLDRLIRVHEIDQFWVFCQVVAIEPMFDWFYVSCKKCFRKMAQAGSTFYCVKCDMTDPIGNLRYRVIVRVADNWGIASFILWDKECVSIIGKTAGELKSTTDGQVLPKAISRIVGFKALFKVNVKDISTGVNLGPFPVMKMATDVQFISQYCNIDSISRVDLEERAIEEAVPAPVRPGNARAIPNVICAGVKRNLMEAFNENEEENEGKAAKTEDV